MTREELRQILESEKETGSKIDAILDKHHDEMESTKSELDTVKTERDQAKADLKTANKTIADLEKNSNSQQDSEKIIEDYKQQLQDLKNQREQDLISNALEIEIVKANGKNSKAIRSLIDMETIKLQDGKVTGVTDAIQKVKESDAYMFGGEIAEPEQTQTPEKVVVGYNGPDSSGEKPKSLGYGKRIAKLKRKENGNGNRLSQNTTNEN